MTVGCFGETFVKVTDLLKFRPMQLAIVLKAPVGAEEMQQVMIEAIGVAKRQEYIKRAAPLTAALLHRLKQ